jgi:DNA-nicking Smr family endonuclease
MTTAAVAETTKNGTATAAPTTATPEPAPAPKPNPAEVKAEVAKYVELDSDYSKSLAHAEAKKAKRDAQAKNIYDRFGKGKYKVGDEILLLTARKSKTPGGPVSYHFRGKNDEGIIGED